MSSNVSKRRPKFVADQKVRYKNEDYIVLGPDGADDLGSKWLVEHTVTKRIASFHASSLFRVHEELETGLTPKIKPEPPSQLNTLDEKTFAELETRLEQLKPLLETRASKAEFKRVATEVKAHWTTVYRWVKRLRDYPEAQISAFVRRAEDTVRPSRLMNTTVEGILEATIDEWVEDARSPSKRVPVTTVIERVQSRCFTLSLQAPHPNTVRNHIWKLPVEDQIIAMKGMKRARDLLKGHGASVTAEYLYDVLQIDHTEFDVEVVAEDNRTVVLGRPALTLATDQHSRMVASFYISFDPPGAISAGVCLAEAMMNKDKFLERHPELKSSWPCEGKPRVVFMDNAKEFRGLMVGRAALEYGFTLQNRPAKQPQFSAVIERAFGTYLSRVHGIPGSTASNPQARTGQEGRPTLTLRELEQWFATFIIDVYHQRYHSTLMMSPLEKWRRGVRGDGDRPARGVLKLERDPLRVRLDFLPLLPDATLQRYGIRRDYIEYFDETVQTLLNQKGMEGDQRREFIIKRDPRDISVIYLYDDEVDQYFSIPSRTRLPTITLWEWRKAKQAAIAQGKSLAQLNESVIFAALQRMDHIVSSAKAATQAAVRQQGRLKTAMRKRKEEGLGEPTARTASNKVQAREALKAMYSFTEDEVESFG